MHWRTEQRKVKDLIPHPQNPRQMTEKQVADLTESLKRFNLAEIPAINTDNQMIAGHMRLKILMQLGRGEEVIDVRVPDEALTEEQVREYMIRSNKNLGEWDWDILGDLFEASELQDWGFSEDELLAGFDLGDNTDDYKDIDAENDSLAGLEDENIVITVPHKYHAQVTEWMANGESKTAPGLGKGVMRRCGLL